LYIIASVIFFLKAKDKVIVKSSKTISKKLEHPGPLLRQAMQRCRGIHDEVCTDLGITTMQTSAIHALYHLGGVTQAALGKEIVMEPPNVHGLVKRLLDKKLITIKAVDNDARANVIKLTASGKKLALKIENYSGQVKKEFLKPLNKSEQLQLQEYLHRLIDAD
jgi:DNA-binding MarR family transcriptional regulator